MYICYTSALSYLCMHKSVIQKLTVNMDGCLSRSEQLWQLALQLAEEEALSISFARDGHGQRIQTKYNQLVNNLSCLGDIIASMYQKGKLTSRELELLQNLQSTPIRASEELLSIISKKSKDGYECFLSLIKATNQMHLYQILVSENGTYENVTIEDSSNHKDFFRRNFTWLSENMDSENGLISLLYQQSVLTLREKDSIICINNNFQKNELLLGLLSKKSPEDFEKFIEALETTGQSHVAKQIRKPEENIYRLWTYQDASSKTSKEYSTRSCVNDLAGGMQLNVNKFLGSPPNYASSAVSTPKIICHKPLPKEVHKSRQKPIRNFSTKLLTLLKPGNKDISSRSLSKIASPPSPKRPTQPTSVQHLNKSMRTAGKNTETDVCIHRTGGTNFQVFIEGLESHLQTAIAIKVAAVSLSGLEKPDDSLKMCLRILLQECRQMKTDLVSRNGETDIESQQLRLNARQYSSTAKLNENVRTQEYLPSVKIMNLEDTIDKLRTDIHTERERIKRFEEKKRHYNHVFKEMKDRLKQAEYDKQQMHDISLRLDSTEHELKITKENLTESNAERAQLMKTCNALIKRKDNMTDIEIQLLRAHKYNQYLVAQVKDLQISLDLVKEEIGMPTVKDNALENAPHLYEVKLYHATGQIEQHNSKLKDRNSIFITQESLVIRRNHQFLLENIDSTGLVSLLHKNGCITVEEQHHLNNEPFSFYRNDALLQWMRTISFKQERGRRVIECFRQTNQNFIVDLLETGGVLIKSGISTKLVLSGLYVKAYNENVNELEEKETKVIEGLNQLEKWLLSNSHGAISELASNRIFIAPYCHREANGIVIWFWCKSIYEERTLKRMYKSDILHQLLIRIFRELSEDKMSFATKLLVPNGINIFACDFTEDESWLHHPYEPPDKYKSDPKLIAKIRTKAGDERRRAINGLTILDKELFIVSEMSSEVEVYDSITLSFSRRLNLKELIDPMDIGSCGRNICMYISDYKDINEPKEILRVDPNGKFITSWLTGDDYGYGLSVTDKANVILTVTSKNKLNEYSPDGTFIREIYLSSDTGVYLPYHAIELKNGHFVIGHSDDGLCGLCIVSNDGKLMKSFGEDRHSRVAQMNRPVYLAADGEGFVMVADQLGSQVLLLNPDLNFCGSILSTGRHRLLSPWKLLLDESTGRIHVANNYDGWISIFQF